MKITVHKSGKAATGDFKYIACYGNPANGKIHPALVGMSLELGPKDMHTIRIEMTPQEAADMIARLSQYLASSLGG